MLPAAATEAKAIAAAQEPLDNKCPDTSLHFSSIPKASRDCKIPKPETVSTGLRLGDAVLRFGYSVLWLHRRYREWSSFPGALEDPKRRSLKGFLKSTL